MNKPPAYQGTFGPPLIGYEGIELKNFPGDGLWGFDNGKLVLLKTLEEYIRDLRETP